MIPGIIRSTTVEKNKTTAHSIESSVTRIWVSKLANKIAPVPLRNILYFFSNKTSTKGSHDTSMPIKGYRVSSVPEMQIVDVIIVIKNLVRKSSLTICPFVKSFVSFLNSFNTFRLGLLSNKSLFAEDSRIGIHPYFFPNNEFHKKLFSTVKNLWYFYEIIPAFLKCLFSILIPIVQPIYPPRHPSSTTGTKDHGGITASNFSRNSLP